MKPLPKPHGLRHRWILGLCLGGVVLASRLADAQNAPGARSVTFADRTWSVRAGHGGPGPNTWDPRNVGVDPEGHLHLAVRQTGDGWSCAEITLQERLGPGRYTFVVQGPIDRFDENLVLGLFNYPTREVGPDATHEIDIEFARWGRPTNPIGNYTVWPVEKGTRPASKTYEFRLTGSVSTHEFDWRPDRVVYRSWQGALPFSADQEIARWEFAPPDPRKRIANQPMPVHLNLWLFQGRPPRDGREVEVVVHSFRFEAPPPPRPVPNQDCRDRGRSESPR